MARDLQKNQGHTAVYYNEAGSARGYIFLSVIMIQCSRTLFLVHR
jgi:hypothetical protein